ncbi:MAG: universal stress protein [Bacteroidetes bacterium]|nr:universal stress protein [Bacteroidota bacterium]
MEKIIVGMNAGAINTSTMEFACYLANLTGSQLTGVFLSGQHADDYPKVKTAFGGAYVETIVAEDIPGSLEEKMRLAENSRQFREMCGNRGVGCNSHQDRGIPLDDLVSESRYADLLVIDPEMSFGTKKEGSPTRFVKDVLSKTECPVAVAPYSFYGVEDIVFACDDSDSSLFAIKQFTYLFPDLASKPLIVVQATVSENACSEEKQPILDYLKLHYSSVRFEQLPGKATNELFGFLLERKKSFVVMGSYGRSAFSDFFRKSTAELLIKTVDLPVFIAHQ